MYTNLINLYKGKITGSPFENCARIQTENRFGMQDVGDEKMFCR